MVFGKSIKAQLKRLFPLQVYYGFNLVMCRVLTVERSILIRQMFSTAPRRMLFGKYKLGSFRLSSPSLSMSAVNQGPHHQLSLWWQNNLYCKHQMRPVQVSCVGNGSSQVEKASFDTHESIMRYLGGDLSNKDKVMVLFEDWMERRGKDYGSEDLKLRNFEIFRSNLERYLKYSSKPDLASILRADSSAKEFKKKGKKSSPRSISRRKYMGGALSNKDKAMRLFEAWMKRHGKEYKSDEEKLQRFEMFRANLEKVYRNKMMVMFEAWMKRNGEDYKGEEKLRRFEIFRAHLERL